MDTLIHADVFFFVTTIAVVVVAIALTVALIYLAMVLRRARDVMGEIKAETILVRDDIHDLRDSMHREGFRLARLVAFVGKLFKFRNKRSKK